MQTKCLKPPGRPPSIAFVTSVSWSLSWNKASLDSILFESDEIQRQYFLNPRHFSMEPLHWASVFRWPDWPLTAPFSGRLCSIIVVIFSSTGIHLRNNILGRHFGLRNVGLFLSNVMSVKFVDVGGINFTEHQRRLALCSYNARIQVQLFS